MHSLARLKKRTNLLVMVWVKYKQVLYSHNTTGLEGEGFL